MPARDMPDPTKALVGRDIVCLGFAEWDAELPTNQHHLMERLAARNRVLFVESLGLRRPQLASRDFTRLWLRLRRGLQGLRSETNVEVLSPLVFPWHGTRAMRAVNQALLVRQVRRASTRLGLRRPIVWAYVPHATYLTEVLQPELVIYHCVDDIAAQKGVHGPSFRALEKKFVREADLVLASSGDLASRLRRWSALVLDAPNVADVPFFSQALGPGPEDYGMQRLRRPRVVFSGAVVATKVNTEWLAAVARLLPNVDFALVGPLGAGDPKTDVSAIEAVPNIHLLGARPYTELPNVLRAADVAMIPYSLNRLTASIFPMKVYEYMAAGLPIVSTPLPSLQGVAGIAFAATPQRAADLITELVATDSADRRRSRSALAQGHSWNDRLDEINDAVAQLLAPGDRVVRRRKLGV